jgi:hypothetical protein
MTAMDEYGTLINEMNRLQHSVRMLWAAAFAVYFGALGVFGALTVTLYVSGAVPDEFFFLLPFLQWGGANAMSAILLGICVSALYFGYTWQRRSYYIGAYLQVFHEAGNPALKWVALDSGDRHQALGAVRADVPRALADSMGILVILALAPAIVCTVYSTLEADYHPASFVVTLVSVPVLFLFCARWYHKLRTIHGELQRFLQAWLDVARDEQALGNPGSGGARYV